MSFDPSVIGYMTSAVMYLLLSGALITVWRNRFSGSHLFAAVLLTAGWSAILGYSANNTQFSAGVVIAFEIACDAMWLMFLSSLLAGGVMGRRAWLVKYAGVALALGLLGLGLAAEYLPAVASFGVRTGAVLTYGSILTSLYALVSLEQIYRNAREYQTSEIKHLCVGLAGISAIDLLLYSNAIFVGEVGTALWAARGFVVAMCAPLMAISIRRRQSDNRGLFVSRKVLFYTTTLIAAGLYLTLIGLAGYLVRDLGVKWSDVARIVTVFGALIVLVVLVISDRLRALVRVYVVKHFFASKYDYREEWLKLIQTLTSSETPLPFRKRAIQALAQIIGSPSGTLWLENADLHAHTPVAAWNMRPATVNFDVQSAFINFINASGWVIDMKELRDDPRRFGQSEGCMVPPELEPVRLIIPLVHENLLVGLVGLTWPRKPTVLNFEDYDFLKLVGKQIAGYLVQEAATERLAESRQFEAFNRLTAFVMHDLKNAIAQQMLVVKNAEKHRRNPEFIDDAIETIKGSVAHMQKVVSQLQQGIREQHADRVDIGKLILQAVSATEGRRPVPVVELCEERVFAKADKERLLMALCHAIRNSQDATPSDGHIRIDLSVSNDSCNIQIADTGKGMNTEFVRDRLFKPFDTTKGTQGMGIGAYQIREAVRSAGGTVRVQSAPGAGTVLCLTLPITP